MTHLSLFKLTGMALCLCLLSPVSLQAQEKKAENDKDSRPARERPEKPDPPKPRAEADEKKEGRKPAPAKRPPVAQESRSQPDRAQPDREKRTWIGVAMAPVPSALRDHLDLAEGFGVQVSQVIDDSPADEAGLRQHDILTKLNDQILTTPEHLQLLVRSMKIGDKVDVTFLRKGKEESVTLTLGESTIPLQSWSSDRNRETSHYGRGGYSHPPRVENWQEMAREQQDRLQKMLDANRGRFVPAPPDGEKKGSAPVRPPAVSVRPGFPVQVVGSEGMIRIDNPQGEVTIVLKDGDHRITIKDDDGREVYEGPYKAGEKDGGLPEKARDYLKKMKLEDLDVLLPAEAEEKPEKVGRESKEKKEGSQKKGEIL